MIRRILAVALFLVFIVPDMLGWEVSLAPGLSLKNALLYVLFIGLAVQLAVEGKLQEIELPALHLAFLLLVLYGTFMWLFASLVASYRNYDMLEGMIALKSLLIDHYLVFLVYFYMLRSEAEAAWVLERILWAVALINGLVVIDSYDIPDLGIVNQDELGRAQGVLKDSHTGANEYARLVILFLPALILPILTAVGLKRLVYLIGVLLSSIALLLTTSRGAFVGLLAGLSLGAFYLRGLIPFKSIAKLGVVLLGVVVLTGIVVSAQFSDLFYERFVGNTEGKDIQSVTSGRNVIWGKALAKQAEVPYTFLTGYGWHVYDSMGFRYGAHNTYLRYLFNLGVIGLALFLLLLAQISRVAKRGAEVSEGATQYQLVAFIIGFFSLLVAIFFSEIFKVWLFFWVYAGIAMRMSVSAIMARGPAYNQSGVQNAALRSTLPSAGRKVVG